MIIRSTQCGRLFPSELEVMDLFNVVRQFKCHSVQISNNTVTVHLGLLQKVLLTLDASSKGTILTITHVFYSSCWQPVKRAHRFMNTLADRFANEFCPLVHCENCKYINMTEHRNPPCPECGSTKWVYFSYTTPRPYSLLVESATCGIIFFIVSSVLKPIVAFMPFLHLEASFVSATLFAALWYLINSSVYRWTAEQHKFTLPNCVTDQRIKELHEQIR